MCDTASHRSSRSLLVIGCGRWGIQHVRAAEELDMLAAVADSRECARQAAVEITNAPVFDSVDAALVHPNVAGVVIATPPASHYEVACAALRAGKDILVEKPLCTNLKDAEDLVQRANQSDPPRIIMVGHILRYSPVHARLIELVRSGFVGQVTRIRAVRMNFGTVRMDENVLWSLCPHDVSTILALCSESDPERVSCTGQCVLPENEGVEDYVDMSIAFRNGIRARLEAAWMHPKKERRVVVYGTKGCLVFNEHNPDKSLPDIEAFKWTATVDRNCRRVNASKEVILLDSTESENEERSSAIENDRFQHCSLSSVSVGVNDVKAENIGHIDSPLHNELRHFYKCYTSRKAQPLTDGIEGFRVLSILQAASDSLRDGGNGGKWVNVEKISQSPREHSQHSDAYFVDKTAVIDDGAKVQPGTKIWHFSHVMSKAQIGASCVIGQNVFVGSAVVLGRNVKVQNNVSLPQGVICEDDVFLGPSCVFTNILNPRAFISRRSQFLSTLIQRGASIGANATILCGTTVGRYALVGAGSVVTRDVRNHALVVGNPARRTGWVGKSGMRLISDKENIYFCPESGERYRESPESEGHPAMLLCECCENPL